MAGEKNIDNLLRGLSPVLNEGEYVFCTIPEHKMIQVSTIATMKEQEGMSMVINRIDADKLGLEYESVFSWITLQIHSSLDAVGLTAVCSKALAERGIPCNMVAGFYHDHLFVPKGQAQVAMETLKAVSKK